MNLEQPPIIMSEAKWLKFFSDNFKFIMLYTLDKTYATCKFNGHQSHSLMQPGRFHKHELDFFTSFSNPE
jgi:hypothetical protein